jgi:hypothetical protein
MTTPPVSIEDIRAEITNLKTHVADAMTKVKKPTYTSSDVDAFAKQFAKLEPFIKPSYQLFIKNAIRTLYKELAPVGMCT